MTGCDVNSCKSPAGVPALAHIRGCTYKRVDISSYEGVYGYYEGTLIWVFP